MTPKIKYDINTIIKLNRIKGLIKEDPGTLERLIQALSDDCNYCSNQALKMLKMFAPMASMLTRREEDENEIKENPGEIPYWITTLCANWGESGDFADLVSRQIAQITSTRRKENFLDKLVLFPGAYNRLISVLQSKKMFPDAEYLSAKIAEYLKLQFPLQINISPTMNCNMHCHYCISGSNVPVVENEMPLDNFVSLINWAKRNEITRIGITGGEPTLYSQFDRMLDLIIASDLEYFFATNGIFADKILEKILETNPLAITMHITGEVRNSELYKTFSRNAQRLRASGKNAILRCNFANITDDPAEYVRIAEETGIREIRIAVIIPNMSQTNDFIETAALDQYASLLDNLVQTAAKSGISVYLAKPFPVCLLKDETALYFLEKGSFSVSCPVHINNYTNNTVIYPDLSYASCLGLDQRFPAPITDSHDLLQTSSSGIDRIRQLTRKPIFEKCNSCPLALGGRCIGACLSYRTLPEN